MPRRRDDSKWKRYCDCLGRQWNSLLETSKTGLDKHAGPVVPFQGRDVDLF